MNKAEIVELVNEGYADEGIVLFDGLENAFLGIATRFEPVIEVDGKAHGGQHRYFAVYSYSKILEGLMKENLTSDEAEEHISYNIEGAYVGESTPAVLHDA